jgi:hypothetical protein
VTRNDLYDFLTREGVQRGFSVLCEFHVDVPLQHRVNGAALRKIDVVWATRREATSVQNANNRDHWRIWAAFEIEGCNVPRMEFTKDVAGFCGVQNPEWESEPIRLMALYTVAWDRREDDWRNRSPDRCDLEISMRKRWCDEDVRNENKRLFRVVDATELLTLTRGIRS